MKKIIYYMLLYIFLSIIQFVFGKYLSVFGIFPNFILIVVAYLGVSKKIINAQVMGFLFGLTWDAFSTDIFGTRALMFTVIGYLIGKFCRDFDMNKILVQFLVILLANIVYWLGFGLIHFTILGNESYMTSFIDGVCCVKVIVTVLIAPIVFHVFGMINKI
ncbi:MAG: rod shape-determining protein MreD [Endomicrobium sp.]|jgi:rod shape-determining protein MreD|nr:rod shape-determining protein MreD [Endomicrobium sp.]